MRAENSQFILFGLFESSCCDICLLSELERKSRHAHEVVIDPTVDGLADEVAVFLRISLGPCSKRGLPRFRGGFVHPVENPGLGIHQSAEDWW